MNTKKHEYGEQESNHSRLPRRSSGEGGYIRVIRGPLVTFVLNENGLARFSLSEAVSVDGCGNVELRDPDDTDGDRFS